MAKKTAKKKKAKKRRKKAKAEKPSEDSSEHTKRPPGRPRVDPMERKVGQSISLSLGTWNQLAELANEKEMRLSTYVDGIIQEHLAEVS